MKEKVKIGIIGVGSISHSHIRAYQQNPNVELYAFCDINEKQLREMGKTYGIERLYTDMNDMLALSELDAVSVCTWNSAHAPCAIAALEAGKHVLCEKPMATSVEEALAMKAAAEKSGKLLMLGFVRRFGNDSQVIRDFIQCGRFGELYYAKASYLRRKGNPGGWFADKSYSGGGPLIDLGVHVIDLVRYLFGNPKAVSVYGATFQKLFDRPDVKDKAGYTPSQVNGAHACDVEDMATAIIRFDNGAVLNVETSFSLNLKEDTGSIQLFGSKAGAKIDPTAEIYTDLDHYMTNVQLCVPTALEVEGAFAGEIGHFVDCVQNGTSCIAPAEDGVELMRILCAVYESARTGHEVVL